MYTAVKLFRSWNGESIVLAPVEILFDSRKNQAEPKCSYMLLQLHALSVILKFEKLIAEYNYRCLK